MPSSPVGYAFFKQLLFRLDAETSHGLAMAGLRVLGGVPGLPAFAARNQATDPRLAQTLFGRTFPNPVGLAAGFDKDGVAVRAWPALGFGFVEVGTVTPRPQPGNPRPRLFRLAAAKSVQNAMGFNNRGMETLRRRLLRLQPAPLPLGINLGKNKATPPEEALQDYEILVRGLADLGDYLVVNLSSPNTPGLRDLQNETFVRAILQMATGITRKPVLVKLSPDLDPGAAVDLAEIAVESGAAGIVATNTTTEYGLVPDARDFGGLSGKVLQEKSFRMLQALAARLFGKTVLVSVGGIDSGEEAYRRLRAGASLVQIYTGLVYQGPGLPRRINREILRLMERDGVGGMGELIGADIRQMR
ncbi:MAG TPA: quinone-dependent dihydroorotate dehydrogenase [Thermoanaerobaculia bacterium]|nr:quinone-dependent dihydroorotate dehydrogenase [Thermoanaerobaculia bacterium]